MPDIQKVSIALTAEQLSILKHAVETGEYATTSEAIREALREWQWKRERRVEEVKHLQHLWAEGKRSGSPMPVDFGATLTEARKRLKKETAHVA